MATGCTSAPDGPGRDDARAPSAADIANGAAALRSCAEPAEPVTALPLPEGVVAARLCKTSSNFTWRTPRQVLTEQVDDLAQLIDVQPRRAPDQGCQRGGGVGFDLRLAYADRTVLSLPGDTACRSLSVAGTAHDGASLVLERFLASLRAQRDPVSAR
jgi:hypothetical protein